MASPRAASRGEPAATARRPVDATDLTPDSVRSAASQLRAHGTRTSIAVADALADTLAPVGAEAQPWVEQIETLRAELDRTEELLSIDDFGAGSRHESLSTEEMARGRTVTKTVGEATRPSKGTGWALLLHLLVRRLRPSTCLELGTCVGISSAYQAAALQLNGSGRLVTIEGADSLARLARDNLRQLGLARADVRVGRFQDVLQPVLAELAGIDFAFVDGHHDEAATVDYFATLLPSLAADAVVVFDDIAWSPGMARAWERVTAEERVRVTVDLSAIGVCLLGASAEPKRAIRVRGRRRRRGMLRSAWRGMKHYSTARELRQWRAPRSRSADRRRPRP